MTKTIIVILMLLLLSGCATPPQWLANHFDSQDPCQRYPHPSWCGASSGRTVIYSTPNNQPLGARIGYTKQKN